MGTIGIAIRAAVVALACLGAAGLFPASICAAAVVGLGDSFDGTSKDPARWEEYTAPGGAVTQDNALTITGVGDYTSKLLVIRAGGVVRTAVTPGSFELAGYAYRLALTNNSKGVTDGTLGDTHHVGVGIRRSAAISFAREGSDNDTSDSSRSFTAGQTYWLEVNRMTRNSFSMKVYAANGTTVLESFSTETEGMPVDLFVSLIANPSGSAMFDDVTASGPGAVLIPEPAALLSLPALSMLLRRRRLALR